MIIVRLAPLRLMSAVGLAQAASSFRPDESWPVQRIGGPLTFNGLSSESVWQGVLPMSGNGADADEYPEWDICAETGR